MEPLTESGKAISGQHTCPGASRGSGFSPTCPPEACRCRVEARPTEGARAFRKSPQQGGFTYIVLLIWVAVVAATLGMVGQVWQTVVQRDRENELLFIGNQFRQALQGYYASNQRYPLRLEDLLRDDRNVGVQRHLRKIFNDPITGTANWGTIKLADGQIVGIYSLSEGEPMKKAGFRARDAGLEDKAKYSEWIFMPGSGSGPAAPPSARPSLTNQAR